MKQVVQNNIYIIIVIILVNIFSVFAFVRIDFTSNNRYSLSKVSKSTIKTNTEPITVDFYVTEDLPQELKKIARAVLLRVVQSTVNPYSNCLFPPSYELKTN